ncbi:MAG: N-acetylneuraminate synthase family protein [Verrucomicrobiota bacterium]
MHPFQATFSIGDHLVGSPANPLLIAEIACAHGGDEEECLNLIQAAAESGADAIQLQVFRAAHQVPPSHKLRPLLESLELSDSSWESLFRAAQATGKIISAFVYDEPSLELALQFDPALLKLNSADLNYVPMLEGAGQSGIPISLGTGASTLEEIKEGLRILREAGAERVLLMHGVQDFPTQIPDARLTRIGLLRKTWNLPMGYADHTEGDAKLAPWMDLLALGQGASVLEKAPDPEPRGAKDGLSGLSGARSLGGLRTEHSGGVSGACG